MESIGQILKARQPAPALRRLTTSAPAGGADTHDPLLPDVCICQTLPGGRKSGWVYASHYADGRPIEPITTAGARNPDYGRAHPCACSRAREAKELPQRLKRWANLPNPPVILSEAKDLDAGRHSAWTFSGYKSESAEQAHALETVKAWAAGHLNERWLLLYGTVGTGKTHLACAAVAALVGARIYARYEWVPDLLDALRQGQADGSYAERIAQLRAVEALVLDDLGANRSTEWAEEELLKLINWRYLEQAPTLVATNVIPAQLEDRIASRLQDRALVRAVPMLWDDYRKRQRSP